MEREKRNRNGNGFGFGNYTEIYSDGIDQNRLDQPETNGFHTTSTPSSSSSSSSPAKLGYIEHPVSKLDTLAGVAIKYGVEVCI